MKSLIRRFKINFDVKSLKTSEKDKSVTRGAKAIGSSGLLFYHSGRLLYDTRRYDTRRHIYVRSKADEEPA